MTESAGRLYFAYGSNMVEPQMTERCPGARLIGPGTLRGYRFLINSHGYATIQPAPSAAVHGLLWRLTPADEASLDRYEGVRPGLYRKVEMEIGTPGAPPVRAFLYVGTDSVPGAPRPGYLDAILAAAERHGLPEPYRRELAAWLRPARGRPGS